MTEREQVNNEVRREMLAAIRQHLSASAPFDAVRAGHHAPHAESVKPGAPVAAVAAVSLEDAASPVERFRGMLEAVAGHCLVVSDETEAAEAVQTIIERSDARRVAVSDSPLVRRVVGRLNSGVELLENPAAPALFDCDIGITGAQWAVAETGTLVLESERERHRLSSLVPPVHIALVEAERVRPTLGEVLAALGERGQDGLSRTVTFITGPSRTSDIELNLAIGVHGPGELYVILINN